MDVLRRVVLVFLPLGNLELPQEKVISYLFANFMQCGWLQFGVCVAQPERIFLLLSILSGWLSRPFPRHRRSKSMT